MASSSLKSGWKEISLKRLIGAAFGSVLGIVGAFLMSLVLGKADAEPFLQVACCCLMTYVGLIVGAKKGDMLNLAALGGVFGGEKSSQEIVQDSRYQRHHRRPHRGHRRNRVSWTACW